MKKGKWRIRWPSGTPIGRVWRWHLRRCPEKEGFNQESPFLKLPDQVFQQLYYVRCDCTPDTFWARYHNCCYTMAWPFTRASGRKCAWHNEKRLPWRRDQISVVSSILTSQPQRLRVGSFLHRWPKAGKGTNCLWGLGGGDSVYYRLEPTARPCWLCSWRAYGNLP